MKSYHISRTLFIFALFTPFVCLGFNDPNHTQDDWKLIWEKRQMKPMPQPKSVHIKQAGTLGEDLGNQDWLMISTTYHTIYFKKTIDAKKLGEIYYLIDNIYVFLKKRNPANAKPAKTPIRTFLVANQLKRSRCCPKINAMRTGDQGTLYDIISSLMHEETHLFNMANLNGKPQNWWLGEFSCQYYQQRSKLGATKNDIHSYICGVLKNGPKYHLNDLDNAGREAFDEAFAALYFFEEHYGINALVRFRELHLNAAKMSKGRSSRSFFVNAFSEELAVIEQKWLKFYGWQKTASEEKPQTNDDRLHKTVSCSITKESVQSVVKELAKQAGIGYNWDKSFQQADPLCRQWLRDLHIQNEPLAKVLKQILEPIGLTFTIEDGLLVLDNK